MKNKKLTANVNKVHLQATQAETQTKACDTDYHLRGFFCLSHREFKLLLDFDMELFGF